MFSYGSVCSGIEAVSVAWQDFATPLWFSEIEAFPCALLQYHYPNIPNLGDMQNLPQKILHREIPAPDVLIGGTPCQSYSYAGKRHSLNDERGGLMLTFINIANAIDKVRKEESSMLNTSDSPNVVAESLLSQVLENNVAAKYSLSPKACAGILRRAEMRGRALPPTLKAALVHLANQTSQEH